MPPWENKAPAPLDKPQHNKINPSSRAQPDSAFPSQAFSPESKCSVPWIKVGFLHIGAAWWAAAAFTRELHTAPAGNFPVPRICYRTLNCSLPFPSIWVTTWASQVLPHEALDCSGAFLNFEKAWMHLGHTSNLPQSVRSSCDLSGTQEVCTSRTVGVAWRSVQGQRFITKSCRMYWKPCSQDTNHRASRGLGLQTKTSFSFTYINHFVATKSKTKLDSARSHWPQSRTAVNTCLP